MLQLKAGSPGRSSCRYWPTVDLVTLRSYPEGAGMSSVWLEVPRRGAVARARVASIADVRAIVAFGGKADIGHGHRNPLRSFTMLTCGVAGGSLTPVGSAPAQTPP